MARFSLRNACILHAVGGTARERERAAPSLHSLRLCKAGGRHVRLHAAAARDVMDREGGVQAA
jgi:hypothetical protein